MKQIDYQNEINNAFRRMKLSIEASSDLFWEMDKMRNAAGYILARDKAIALGANVRGYPKSIGEVDWELI